MPETNHTQAAGARLQEGVLWQQSGAAQRHRLAQQVGPRVCLHSAVHVPRGQQVEGCQVHLACTQAGCISSSAGQADLPNTFTMKAYYRLKASAASCFPGSVHKDLEDAAQLAINLMANTSGPSETFVATLFRQCYFQGFLFLSV